MPYIPTIGLEIHAELSTASKLFCGCGNNPHESEPNEHICPVCVGYPGALPRLNKRAVEQVLRVGRALGGELADETRFDRKHYFYPDIPKGYQISQYRYPLVRDARLLDVGIRRIHLEEDTAKSSHDVSARGSVIDFNRSGVPLMELVTEPVLHTAEDATRFGEALQLALRYLRVSHARMERGEMRIEANISVSDTDKPGSKVEVKNLNSFKAVGSSIAHEIARQSDLLAGGGAVAQETRGWNENTGKTFSQRLKETSEEYRYMPEPDLPAYRISAVPGWDSDSLAATVPEMPEQRMARYTRDLGLPANQAEILVKTMAFGDLFDATTRITGDGRAVQLAANYLTSDILSYADTLGDRLFDVFTADALAEMLSMLIDGSISSRGAKTILTFLARDGGMPREIAAREHLLQESDEETLKAIAERVIEANPVAADSYRSGKKQALQFLIGQVMRETKGSSNPAKTGELLKSLLS